MVKVRVERPLENAVLQNVSTSPHFSSEAPALPQSILPNCGFLHVLRCHPRSCCHLGGALSCWLLPPTTAAPSHSGPTQVTVLLQGHPLCRLRFPRKSEAATLALTSPHRNYLFRGLMPQRWERCLIQLCNQPQPTPSTSQTLITVLGMGPILSFC